MPLNAVVREKRKELGLTQEQVADYLGVTAPAVHKWEKGATYPDVALLPALARLLKIDLNTLLCFHEELSQKEIGLFLNRVTEVFHREGFETALALAMEKVREYPANAGLLHSLAMVLQGSLMMTDFPVQQKESYEAQIIALYERVVDCNDPKYSSQASYMLASRLITAKEYEKAQERLDALPEPNALDRRTLQARLWMQTGKSEDAAQLLEHKLLASLQEMQATLTSLATIAVQEGDEENALRLAHCGQQQVELFGLWNYGAYLVPLETAVARKDVAGTLSTLQTMLAALLVPWEMTASPVCKHIAQKPGEKNFGAAFLAPVLQDLENSSSYDFLRTEPAFEQLLGQYRAKLENP